MNSDEEMELKKYLKKHGESVSYAGGVIRSMARAGKFNLFENARKTELITDDELRRVRKSMDRHRDLHDKRVSISKSASRDTTRHKVKRKQTGFVHKEDVDSVYEAIRDREDEAVKEEPETDEDVDDDDGDDDENRKVRIDPLYSTDRVGRTLRRPTGYSQSSLLDLVDDDDEVEVVRPSVLERLYPTTPTDGVGPTLKDFKPLSEQKQQNILLTMSTHFDDDPTENLIRQSMRHSMTRSKETLDHVLNLQHGKTFARRISSDYVKTIDHIEQKKPENSIRSVEFARTRPALSVAEYQEKNKKYHENVKKAAEEQLTVVLPPHADFEVKQSGIRLPGDTPTYLSTADLFAE